jgi:glutamate formiminotransferase/formiminotetrahydrofolate cyclodeaminase
VAASLVRMVAGLTVGKKKYAAVEGEMKSIAGESEDLARRLHDLGDEDANAYAAVSAAYKMPREPEGAAAARIGAIDDALTGAADVPLETARLCARVAELAAATAARGNSNADYDSGVAALLAEAACRGAAYNVRINISSLSSPQSGSALVAEAEALLARAETSAKSARDAVDRAIG